MLWIDEIEKYLSVVQSSGAINGDVFSYMDARENVSGVRNIMRKNEFQPEYFMYLCIEQKPRVVRKTQKVSRCEIGGDDLKD